jgi:hypothetical protein
MKVVLAEKPSVAREITAVLGADARRDGYFKGGGYQVTWALGHLATLKEPEDYDPALKPWSLATLPFVPERFGVKLIEDPGARKQFAIVRRLFRAANELIRKKLAGRVLGSNGLGNRSIRVTFSSGNYQIVPWGFNRVFRWAITRSLVTKYRARLSRHKLLQAK